MGLGYGRQRAGIGVPEEVRFSDGAERAHSPDHAKNRRQRDVSHGRVHFFSATSAWKSRFTGSDEGAGGPVAEPVGNYRCELCAGPACAGGGGLDTGINRKKSRVGPEIN